MGVYSGTLRGSPAARWLIPRADADRCLKCLIHIFAAHVYLFFLLLRCPNCSHTGCRFYFRHFSASRLGVSMAPGCQSFSLESEQPCAAYSLSPTFRLIFTHIMIVPSYSFIACRPHVQCSAVHPGREDHHSFLHPLFIS